MARASGTYHVPVTRFFCNFSFVREGLVTTCNRPQPGLTGTSTHAHTHCIRSPYASERSDAPQEDK